MAIMLNVRSNVYENIFFSASQPPDSSTILQIAGIAVGKAFVFSYLTDVKILRPAIDKHMKKMVRNKQIDEFMIETFDNRGPYVLVVLSEKNRGKDVKAVATEIAESLHTNLTKTNKLKVNQVVIKVVDPEQYTKNNRVKVVGRGTAGQY